MVYTAVAFIISPRRSSIIRSKSGTTDTTKFYSAPPRKRSQDDNYFDVYKYDSDINNNDGGIIQPFNRGIYKGNKPNELSSSFWYSTEHKNPKSQEEVIPYQSKLDSNGNLPYGSYKLLGKQEYEAKRMCVVTVGLDFWNRYESANQIEIDNDQAIQNMHHLIDSGFKSFQLNNLAHEKTSLSAKTWQQQYIEQHLYHQLVKQTPRSVLNECSLCTRINVPQPPNDGDWDNNDSAFAFRESDIRQRIGQSIVNMYGNTAGCLDSVQVPFQHLFQNDSSTSATTTTSSTSTGQTLSPYTLDTLNVLQEMQREGLIRSINGLNFPYHTIQEIERNGFSLDYNQIESNLLDPSRYTTYVQHVMNSSCNRNSQSCNNRQVVLGSVLAGGLLTNRYSNIANSCLNRNGEPIDGYMLPSELSQYKGRLKKIWIPSQRNKFVSSKQRRRTNENGGWQLFQSHLMRSLEEIACKYQVSIASVAIRWSIQLDQVGSVVIGSSLNTKFDNDERPFTRPSDLREVFSFELDDDDMDKLWDVSSEMKVEVGHMHDFDDDRIDFGNKKLWL